MRVFENGALKKRPLIVEKLSISLNMLQKEQENEQFVRATIVF
jgi:hypothetical protein